MTAVAERPVPVGSSGPPPEKQRFRLPRWTLGLGVLVVWIAIWAVTKGQDTLVLPGREHTDLHDALTGFRDSVLGSRDTNPVIQLTYQLGESFTSAVDWLQRLVSVPDFPRPVPQIGWLGVTALAAWVALAIAGWRTAVLVGLSFLSFGMFGYWSDSMDLLIVTFVAVAASVIIGLPLAVWVGTSKAANTVLSNLLDLMQTMPTFVYLLPIVLFFGIGASAAVVATLVYALPPIIRIAGYGIRSVPETTIEATDAAGQTAVQRLLKVQLPMARKTIVVGLNQTIMAALSMATIASYVDGPGLGKPVLDALVKNNVGNAFVPGMLIVVMAVMLDRTTTAASERSELVARGGGGGATLRRVVLGASALVALVLVYLSRTYGWAAEFPATTWGPWLSERVDSFVGWVTATFGGFTEAVKNVTSDLLLNPMQSLLAESPWWLTGVAILALAWIVGGLRASLSAVVCLAGIWYLDLWHDAMITLNMTLVATLMVMVLALVLGVWMARRRGVDLILRPLLDAGQTIPPFVYLIPVLALFGPTRFTAIVAGIVYAAPAAIKLVADGVKGVSPNTIEASRSTGATTWQEITKVQLPMARGSLVLAANQGLLYVLAMAVIGGMVGAGALGYDVVLGFSRSEEWGKGAAAGLTIVLLGIMIDRITRAAAERSQPTR
ncbi:ABC transporter permease [Nocardioides luteus]|uniref:ABC transporter permease n=1 Tax=Nocardioides luteus TaxID=1844 RepID=UPI0018CA0A92|nr:ABC transporter permease subunit [Nocardioides luteus]MBG6094946.1 glycine betaine/proline transport system permease protein [Nocardioides luteus]